jgi:hypothetical protein
MLPTKFRFILPSGCRPPDAILVSDWSISKKSSPLKLLSHMNRNLVGSIYMYGRFCIKFPQSRMKGERHSEMSNLHRGQFHRCCLPSFGSFGQAVSEGKIFLNRPIRNKNCQWRPCLLTDRN